MACGAFLCVSFRHAELQMKSDVRLILLIFSLALVLRFIYLLENSSSPLFTWPVLDEQSLDAQGQSIASGNIAGSDDCFRAPLYPLILGAVHAISPTQRFFLIRVIQHILGALTCILVFIVTREAFGRRAGVAAGLIAACYGPLIFFEGTILTETVFIFLNALCLAMLALGSRLSRKALFLAGGIALGLSAVTRPNILLFLPAALLWIIMVPAIGGWKQKFVRTFLVVIPVIIVIGAVSLRNYVATGDLVMVSSQGGANFYLGNIAGANGMPPPTRMVYGTPGRYRDAVESSSAQTVAGLAERPVAPSEVSSACFKATLQSIRGNTKAWFKLMVRKFVLFWNNFEIKNVKDYYFWKQSSLLLSVLPVSFGFIVVLGLFGAVVSFRFMNSATVLIGLYVLSFMTGIVVFFVCARLRLPVVVGLIPLAGAGIAFLLDAVATRSLGRLVAYAAILAPVCGFTFVDWCGVKSFDYSQEYWLLGKRNYDLGEFDKAMESFKASISQDTSFTGSYFFLGNCYWQRSDYETAKICYETVLKMDPANPQALNALGAYAEISGDPAQAAELYRKSIASAREYAKPKTNLGLLLLRDNQKDQARLLFNESLWLDADDPESHLGLALCSSLEGNSQASAECLRKAESLGGAAEYSGKFKRMLLDISGKNTGK